LIHPRELARSITSLENHRPDAIAALKDAVRTHPGAGRVIGITGPPGAGKSSLVDAVARELRKSAKTVAILAVDPSSRSTRGHSGGLAATTSNVAEWLRTKGFDYVLIETVGVGQDEIAIAGVADIVAVILVPGMGDDVQAIKAGLMEIADLYVVNKADYDGADRTVNEIEAMLNLGHGPKPAILKTIATQPCGITELIAQIDTLPRRRHHAAPPRFSIDHIGIAVRSLEQSARFYHQLGLITSQRETVPQEKVNVVMLPTGESRIELLEPSEPDSTIAKFIEKRGEGLHHVALRVPDLESAVAALTLAGARVLHEPRRGAGGHLYTFVHPSSSSGVLWELIQDEGAGSH
jgi:LAO/AO transport system kinase